MLGVVASVLAVVCKRTQQLPTTCNKACKRTKHVTSNNIGSCWPTMLRPYARGFKLDNVARLVTFRSPVARFACFRVNDTLLHRITYKVWISTIANFFTSTHVNFTRVNNIERYCIKFRTNRQLLRLRTTFQTMPLFYLRTQSLRAYASKITRQWKSTHKESSIRCISNATWVALGSATKMASKCQPAKLKHC